MKKIYNFSTDADRIAKPRIELALLILVMSLFYATPGQSSPPLVKTKLLNVADFVNLKSGGILSNSINNIEPGQSFRIQQTSSQGGSHAIR